MYVPSDSRGDRSLLITNSQKIGQIVPVTSMRSLVHIPSGTADHRDSSHVGSPSRALEQRRFVTCTWMVTRLVSWTVGPECYHFYTTIPFGRMAVRLSPALNVVSVPGPTNADIARARALVMPYPCSHILPISQAGYQRTAVMKTLVKYRMQNLSRRMDFTASTSFN